MVHLWNATTGAHNHTLEGHRDGVTSVAFNPNGNTLASGSWDETVRLWDAATGENIRTLEGHTHGVNSVAFSADGNTLASAGGEYDGTVRLWDAATGAHKQTLEGNNSNRNREHVYSVLMATRLPACPAGGQIRLWDTRRYGALKRTLTVSSGDKSLYSVAFSPDGRRACRWGSVHNSSLGHGDRVYRKGEH